MLEELAITIEEGVQYALLLLRAGIATVDLPKGFSDNPVNFQGGSLDDLLTIYLFPEALQGGSSGVVQVLARGCYGSFLCFACSMPSGFEG